MNSTTARVMKSDAVTEAVAAGQYNYEDLRLRCENYLDTVREQSRQMLLDSQQEIEKLKQKAMEEGRKEGLQQGLAEAEKNIEERTARKAKQLVEKRLGKLSPALEQAVGKIHEERQRAEAYWQKQAVQLVLAISEKLIHQSIALNPQLAARRIEEVLKLVVGQAEVQLHVSQQDLNNLESELDLLTDKIQQTDIRLIGHEELASGECLVQMKYGEIDARLETQLRRVAEELVGEHNTEQPSGHAT